MRRERLTARAFHWLRLCMSTTVAGVVGFVVLGQTTSGAAPLVASVSAGHLGGGSPRASTSMAVGGDRTPAVDVCGVAHVYGQHQGGLLAPVVHVASSHPSPRTLVLTSSLRGFSVDPANGDIYADTDSSVIVTTADGNLLHSFSLPRQTLSGQALRPGNANNSLVVDPAGNIELFLQRGDAYDLVSLSPSGSQRWDLQVQGVPNGLFSWHDTSGAWAAAVVLRSKEGVLVSPSGRALAGREPVPGTGNFEYATTTSSGGLLYTDGNYVHVLDSSGSPIRASSAGVPAFGSSESGYSTAAQTPGGPFAFATMGGAVEVGSAIYVADMGPEDYGHVLEMFTRTGVYEGAAPSSDVGSLDAGSPLYYSAQAGELLFANSAGVAGLTLGQQADLVRAPSGATQGGFSDSLGVGAGLEAAAQAGYFSAGEAPSVVASFDQWWASYPDPLELRYSVGDPAQVTDGTWPKPRTVAVPTHGGGRLRVRLSLPPAVPGTYLVNANLVDTSNRTTIGSTCLTYSIGMPRDTLNFRTLANGLDYGGPEPVRGVELASELGTGGMREGVSFGSILPNCRADAPTASTCGPGALTDWSSLDPATGQAAAKAAALGVHFEVTFGQDVPLDEALVSSGFWGPDVQAIIEHFHQSAPDVTDVEAWNEPNTGPYSPATYVQEILEPFYQAVQLANAAGHTDLQVIGGTVLGMDVSGWWSGIARAGGFRYMNIAAIHPYPGYDRSFEEQGIPAGIQQLRDLMRGNGAGSMPIWVTEQGWWSDGEEAFYDVGNWAPRAWMWLRSFGITSWNYFITEGQFAGYPTDFSLIDASDGDYFVKPGALGLMTVSNVLGDRPFVRMVPLDIPHAYAMLFGPSSRSSGSGDVLAVWTDDLDVPAQVSLTRGSGSVTIPATGSLGEPGRLTLHSGAPAHLELSGAPVYLSVPAGDSISIEPTEAFGPDFALRSQGAKAQATSAASATNSPSDVITGNASAENEGDASSTPAWIPASGDRSPAIEVRWSAGHAVNRVIVATSSIASVLPGLRDYAVQLYKAGRWRTVASVTNEYFDRMELVSFPVVSDVTGVRIVVRAADYGAVAGGLRPYFWGSAPHGIPGQPAVYSIEAYGP
jgi:hypothetical protein